MKLIIKLIIIVLSIFSILVLFAYFGFQNIIKQQIIPSTTAFIKEQTQLNVSFKNFTFSFSKLLQLKPAIKIEGLSIENSISAKKILIKLYLKPLLKKKFIIKQVTVDNLEFILQENAKHEVSIKGINAQEIAKAINAKKKNQKNKNTNTNLVSNIELNKLSIKNSTIKYYAYKAKKSLNIYPINLELTDLGYGANDQLVSKIKFDAKLFNTKSSGISGSGTMGPLPLDLKYIPVTGKEVLTIFINDIPEAERKLLLGTLVINDSSTRITQESMFKGDLLSTIRGSGNVEFKDLILGKSKAHHLTASSSIPLHYTLRLNKNPNLKLESNNAILNLTGTEAIKGILRFDTYISYDLDTAFMEGSSQGKLSGLEIEETLNCFSDFRKLISGVFEVPNYHAYFRGANANQIGKSLQADGSIEIKDGSLYILRNITKYKDLAATLIKNGDELTEKLSGQFITLKTDFKFKNADLYTDNIALQTPNVNIIGSGLVKASQALEYSVFLDITGLRQIPIKIRGTIKKPKIYPDIKAIGQEQSKQLVNSALEYGLNALKQYAEQNTKSSSSNGTTSNSTQIKLDKKKLKTLGNQLLKGIILEPKTPTTPTPAQTTPATGNGTGL